MKQTLPKALLWALPTILSSFFVLLLLDACLLLTNNLASDTGAIPQLRPSFQRLSLLLERVIGGKQVPFSLTTLLLGSILVALITCSISLHKLVVLKCAEVDYELKQSKKR